MYRKESLKLVQTAQRKIKIVKRGMKQSMKIFSSGRMIPLFPSGVVWNLSEQALENRSELATQQRTLAKVRRTAEVCQEFVFLHSGQALTLPCLVPLVLSKYLTINCTEIR